MINYNKVSIRIDLIYFTNMLVLIRRFEKITLVYFAYNNIKHVRLVNV